MKKHIPTNLSITAGVKGSVIAWFIFFRPNLFKFGSHSVTTHRERKMNYERNNSNPFHFSLSVARKDSVQ